MAVYAAQLYEKRRGSPHRTGTRAAHNAIDGVGRKEYGRFEIHLHGVANALVEEAVEYGCAHIVCAGPEVPHTVRTGAVRP